MRWSVMALCLSSNMLASQPIPEDDCGSCAATEYTLTKKLGQKQADKVFEEHWSTWFTQVGFKLPPYGCSTANSSNAQEDVDLMVNYGLNAVRMPIGWWIIEELKGDQDHFPGGQLPYLKRALRMLKEAGIAVLLDIHANPGVQAANQMFTGQWCRPQPPLSL